MKILVTGARGVVGEEFVRQAQTQSFFESVIAPELDVTDEKRVLEIVLSAKPEAIVHFAAKTNVDWCERNGQECYNINVNGTKNICAAAQKIGALVVYPSTTYLYDGEKGSPYDDRIDKVVPEKIMGIYSKSKWEGELLVSQTAQQIIVRFGALFGGGVKDKKFVAKIVEKVRGGEKEIRAVSDRVVQPSSVKDTVRNLIRLIEVKGRGVFNMVGLGWANYAEYAQAVVDILGARDVKVVPISSSQFAESAPRARDITAINGRLDDLGINLMRDWRVSLKEYIDECFK